MGYDEDGFHFDIVICVDATAKMAPVIDQIKDVIHKTPLFYYEAMEEYGYLLSKLRIKVIAFRDYQYDDEPMMESPFYTIPERQREFKAFLNGIEAKGGSDDGANAFEAIALAIKSDWTTKGERRRHHIIVFTNEKAIPLGVRSSCPNYPEGMPADLEEMGNWWQGVTKIDSTFQYKNGRLLVHAPHIYPWDDIPSWNRYWAVFSEDLSDVMDIVFVA